MELFLDILKNHYDEIKEKLWLCKTDESAYTV